MIYSIFKYSVFVLFIVTSHIHSSYAQNYFVKNEISPNNGYSAVFMMNNYITPRLQVSAGLIRTKTGDDIYILATNYSGGGRLSAETLYLFIDGEEYILNKVVNRSNRGDSEIVGFQINKEILKRLGEARHLRINLQGNWSIKKEIEEIHVKRFAAFYTEHAR